MNALWQGCCRDCGEATCPDMCLRPWKTSYSVTSIGGEYSYALTKPNAKACTCENISEQQFHRREYSVTATWQQVGAAVITRSGPNPGGACCYYGTGTAEVTVSLEVIDYRYCCITGVETISNTQNVSRTLDVPMCLSLICDLPTDQPCQNIPDRRMTFNICICGFSLDGNFDLCDVTESDFLCENLVCSEVGLYVHGICYEHAFPLKPPSTLLSTEKIVNRLCASHQPCSTYPQGTGDSSNGCMMFEDESTQANGPFAIEIVGPFTIGLDEPGICSREAMVPGTEFSAVHALSSCGETPTAHCAPCWSVSKESDCCEAIVGGGPNTPYPVFT